MFYKILIRPVFFILDAEAVHNFVLKFFSKAAFAYPLLKFIYAPKNNLPVKTGDLIFKNLLGLAAGFDKNGIAIRFWEAIGFSHVEVGTVTPLSQTGNPKPRIFRLKKDHALINRLGFNNKGAEQINKNIEIARRHTGKDFIIGVNIGKNKNTPIKDAFNDYRTCFEKLYDAADYFTINISSPNTEGLRTLHEKEHLDHLLSEIQLLNTEISAVKNCKLKKIFLKIAPDISTEMIEMIFHLSIKNKITGIVATNTTVERAELKSRTNENGGLSGKPLKAMSDKVLSKFNDLVNANPEAPLMLIGVGGVFGRNDFNDKMNSGASLIQVYTGFIYEGPAIIKKILL
ncbi:MAG: quinone-dependent dihydroorotate dehydrogenase [bacterium]|nr:quinone-dependent dihydroorotate dehydrogenase [bacterium]